MDDYLTVVEVAALIRVHKQTVYRLIWAGELPVIDIGSGKKRPRLRVRRSGVDQFMARRERGA
ncbi:helix-turn-helix domain-containing protein [Micromonospora sp. NPDC047738]|uniref:helix-turn-helix domain-containing protein n=1 Tax=Micromonospora sp. NPDC047738 TaxID=3155741 RepID=UPI0033E21004